MNETISQGDGTVMKTEQKSPVQTILSINDKRIDDLWKTIDALAIRLRYALSVAAPATPATSADKACTSGESELHAHIVAQGEQFKDMNSTLNSIINRLTL